MFAYDGVPAVRIRLPRIRDKLQSPPVNTPQRARSQINQWVDQLIRETEGDDADPVVNFLQAIGINQKPDEPDPPPIGHSPDTLVAGRMDP